MECGVLAILWQIRFGLALSDRDANLKYGAIQASSMHLLL
jgi:hypothetical protein